MDDVLNTSLLSIAQLCRIGCVATFSAKDVTVTYNNLPVLYGLKSIDDNLWTLPTLPLATASCPAAHAAYALPSDAEFVKFTHAAFGSPSITTLTKAVRRGYLDSYPRLTSLMLTAHPPNSIATAQGHLDQHRQGQNSTQIPVTIFNTKDTDEDLVPTDAPTQLTAYTRVVLLSDTLHSDLTGRFPVPSHNGSQYIFVSVLDGYIHVETMKTRHHTEYVTAYKKTLNFFAQRGRRPAFQRLDNETSGPLEVFANTNNISIQYCPPHTHRSLKAERAIRTLKNHFIATLCTAAPEFPMTLWDELLPQAELCLNHLLPYSPNPSVSAYAGLHGGALDFARHPIAPAGTRILIHDKPSVRSSWAPHRVPGYYLGPALQHYRSYRVWSSTTKATRISDTLAWFPHGFVVPGPSPHENLLAAIMMLKTALTQFTSLHPQLRTTSQPGVSTVNALITDLAGIMGTIIPGTTDTDPTRTQTKDSAESSINQVDTLGGTVGGTLDAPLPSAVNTPALSAPFTPQADTTAALPLALLNSPQEQNVSPMCITVIPHTPYADQRVLELPLPPRIPTPPVMQSPLSTRLITLAQIPV